MFDDGISYTMILVNDPWKHVFLKRQRNVNFDIIIKSSMKNHVSLAWEHDLKSIQFVTDIISFEVIQSISRLG